MVQSKLNNFILFHLFKLPAVLALIAVAGLLFSQQIKEKADLYQSLVRAKQQINQDQIDKYGHLLNQSTTLVDFLKEHGLNATIISTDPVKIETDLPTMQKLESFGVACQEAESSSNHVTATLKPYPPLFKQHL
jgi:hypothetical protein